MLTNVSWLHSHGPFVKTEKLTSVQCWLGSSMVLQPRATQGTTYFSCGGKADIWGLYLVVWGALWMPGCFYGSWSAGHTHSLVNFPEVDSSSGSPVPSASAHLVACLLLLSASVSPLPSFTDIVQLLGQCGSKWSTPSHLKSRSRERAVAELAGGCSTVVNSTVRGK